MNITKERLMELRNAVIDILGILQEIDGAGEIEIHALLTERAGMDAENEWRARRGEGPAYGIEHYRELADRIRCLSYRMDEI